MNKDAKQATIFGIIANIFLFVIKLVAGLLSGSIAIISDALNSLQDIVASSAIYYAVKISSKKPDANHPFGHHRAEPIAGIMVAILTGILGFEILRGAVLGLIKQESLTVSPFTYIALIISILLKAYMHFYFKRTAKKTRSPAINASAVDAKNDVLISSIAIIAIVGASFNQVYLDSIAAIIISAYIFRSGYDIALDNIKYLMGATPDTEMLKKILKLTNDVNGVKGVHDIRAHYVGNYVHVALHIEVNKKLSTLGSHAIGKKVSNTLEKVHDIDRAFVHIDPR